MTTYFYSPKPLRTPPARWGGRLPPLGTHPPRYMHFLFAFIYPRKLSTITVFPHSSHQHIIKWLPTPLGTYLPRYLPYAVGYLGRCGWLLREVRICGVGRGCGSCAVRGGVLTGPSYLLNLLVKLTGPSYSNVSQGSSRHNFHSVCSALLPLPKHRRVQAPACPSTRCLWHRRFWNHGFLWFQI